MGQLSAEDIRKQSENAYGQWCQQWRKHAKIHKKLGAQKSLEFFRASGVGKACLVVANGYTLEKDLEAIKEAAKSGDLHADVICCDKTLGHCIEAGISPTFCLVADANVNYEKYLKPYEDKLDQTTLLMNVCGNPKWSQNGNWQERYFYVLQDILQSEKEFGKLSGCPNVMPASTNVSNAMVVILTQCDNKKRGNFMGYDKYLLLGFDYSWDEKYYAFDEDGGGKTHYMRHIQAVNSEGNLCYTSNNLLFSAKWLSQYINTFNLPIVQCSRGTILELKKRGHVKDHLSYNYKQSDSWEVKRLVKDLLKYRDELKRIDERLMSISKDHDRQVMLTI